MKKLTQSTILHESLHNLTGLDDPDLYSLLTGGGTLPAGPTDVINTALIQLGCVGVQPDIMTAAGTASSRTSGHLSLSRGNTRPSLWLRQTYAHRNISAYIFSSYEAARGFLPASIDPPPEVVVYRSKLHGMYTYNQALNENYVVIMPDIASQYNGSPLATRIDLPSTQTPVCRLAIDGRCLLEFQDLPYPFSGGRTRVTGTVTVAASIRPDGVVSPPTVTAAQVNPVDRQGALIGLIVQNLKTWRFEPGRHSDQIRVTYTFDLSDSLPVGRGVRMQFSLPGNVKVDIAQVP